MKEKIGLDERRKAEQKEKAAAKSKMNVDALLQTLPIMGKGMLGIFIVTVVIIFMIVLLNRFAKK